jgi:hypothetical protein
MAEEIFNPNNEKHMAVLRKFIYENKDKIPKIPIDSVRKEVNE